MRKIDFAVQAGFGFQLNAFEDLADAADIEDAISKGGTFFFFLPVCTTIAGFLSVISDNTHLALFYSLLASTVLAGCSALATMITFNGAVQML